MAKSSAKSELHGIIKASSEGLGMRTLMADLETRVKVRVHVDASAQRQKSNNETRIPDPQSCA